MLLSSGLVLPCVQAQRLPGRPNSCFLVLCFTNALPLKNDHVLLEELLILRMAGPTNGCETLEMWIFR